MVLEKRDYRPVQYSTWLFGRAGAVTSAQNTCVGDSAMYATTTGAANTALGLTRWRKSNWRKQHCGWCQALISNVWGSRNVALGRVTLISSTGSDNTAIGTTALNACTTGQYNSALGGQALQNLTT